jgi:saccharopine dehydrogenase-like NADP-dependent oxidoreductase
MRALVLGGYGAVGSHLVAELRAAGHLALVAGRDATRSERVVDLSDRDSYSRALVDIDVVINASGIEDPRIASMATERAVGFVDISATAEYLMALERVKPAAPILTSVGLAPGLTNLLAAAVHGVEGGPIDLAVLLGAGERHGVAATKWSYRLLGRRFRDPADARWIRNYTKPRSFDLPGYGLRRLCRVDFSDQHTLTRDLKIPVRTYFGLDSRFATATLSALTWIPGASKAPTGIHLPGSDRWLVLARGASGTTRFACGTSQSRATAVVASAAADIVTRLPPGVHHLHRWMSLADLPRGRGIEIDGQPTD